MLRQIFTLLLCTLLAVPLPAAASTYTTLPGITLTPQMVSLINALNYYGSILKAGGKLTSAQMTTAGNDTVMLANLLESAGITAKIDAWIRTNQAALLAHYTAPATQTAIKYAATYGSHYVLYQDGQQVKTAAGTKTGSGPSPYVSDGCFRARLVADSATVAGTVLTIAGGPETPWGAVGMGFLLGGSILILVLDSTC